MSKRKNKPNALPFIVLYEDNHIIAVDKPGGWLVQSDETGDKTLSDFVKEYIKEKYDKPGAVFLGTVHRIDRPVSGVVIFGRTSKAVKRLNELFRDRKIEKTYWAITTERPDPERGTLTHWIKKDTARNISKALDRPSNRSKDAKKAILDYRLLAQLGNSPLIEVKPHTGRPHQIRVQLSKIGCPIRCDVKYGAPEFHKDSTIYLHARSLSFVHPVTKEDITITAAAPRDQVWDMYRHLFAGGFEDM